MLWSVILKTSYIAVYYLINFNCLVDNPVDNYTLQVVVQGLKSFNVVHLIPKPRSYPHYPQHLLLFRLRLFRSKTGLFVKKALLRRVVLAVFTLFAWRRDLRLGQHLIRLYK